MHLANIRGRHLSRQAVSLGRASNVRLELRTPKCSNAGPTGGSSDGEPRRSFTRQAPLAAFDVSFAGSPQEQAGASEANGVPEAQQRSPLRFPVS